MCISLVYVLQLFYNVRCKRTQYKCYLWTYDMLPSTGDRLVATTVNSSIQYRHREREKKNIYIYTQISVNKVGFESMFLYCLWRMDSTCISPRRYGVRRASRDLFICANTRALQSQHPGCLWTHLISSLNETIKSVLQYPIGDECYKGSIEYPFVWWSELRNKLGVQFLW